ncbi:hypothetical protein DER45DRAFT_491815 [Fusarium avenaceum]|nr:hypothetical protein DER45DRAFT_491815 [Fusarium avenaceum]
MKISDRIKSRIRGRTDAPTGTTAADGSPCTKMTEPSSQASTDSADPGASGVKKRGLFLLVESKPDPSGVEDYPVDIVAVHGLNGDAYSTWRHEPDGTLWLEDLLPDSLPGSRIYTYGYPSKVFSQSVARVQEFARDLLVSLRDTVENPAHGKRPIIFICHSLGGIVFKQALVTAHEDNNRYGEVLQSIAGVIFLATPHRGSQSANLGHIVGTIVNTFRTTVTAGLGPRLVRTDLLQTLIYDNDTLEDLSMSARSRLGNIAVVSCYENEPTAPSQSLIVSRASATLNIPNEEPIPMHEDHKSICRFPGKTDSYKKVAKALQRIASQCLINNPVLKRASTHSSTLVFGDLERTCMALLNDHDAAKDTAPPPKPLPGTCQWIYSHHIFGSWLGQNSSALLWLTGHPGSGKTTMSYSLAEHFKDTAAKSNNVLVYLCQNKNRQTDGRAVLIGLILQIVDRHPSLMRHIRSVFERQGSSMIQSFALLWRIFLNLLRDAKMGSPYIIIDALDECEEASCRQLLRSISDMLAESGSSAQGGNTVKFLITSRPFLHDAYASTREPYRSRISIDDGHAGYVDDLCLFIQRRVDEITASRQFPTEIRDFLLQTATSKADSTFLWIHMVFASIEKSMLTSKKDFQKIIASIPKDLKEVYQRYFSAIPSHYQDDASNLIKLLLSCSRPLHLDELNIAFTVNNMHITTEDVMSEAQGSITHTVQGILGTLVRVTGRHVSLIHQSLKEYLLEQGDAKYDSFPAMRMVNAQSSALQLATACIRYLLLQDFETDFFLTGDTSCEVEDDIADLSDDSSITRFGSNFCDDDGPDLAADVVFGETGALYPDICDSMTSDYAFYNYASLHWAEHYALCEEVAPDDLRAAAESLLDTDTASGRNWLHFYYTRTDHSIEDDNLAQKSPILLASQFNLNTVLNDLLVGESPSLDTKNRSLYWASRLGHNRIVASLLKIEADPNLTTSDGQTPLTAASEYGNLGCVIELLKDSRTDAGLTGRKGRNALSFACGNGHDEIVNLLLRRNRSFANDTDHSGATPLFWAVGAGHQSTISTLARVRIVDLNHEDKTGRTAISWAAGDGMVDTLARLLRFPKIDVNLKDKKGKSPLCWAAGNGCDGAVRLLLKNKKVDKSAVDNDQRNAISWAAAGGHHDTLVSLIDGGCPGVDDEDIDNWTALAWATQMDVADIIRALVNNDQVDIERRDGAGRTALSWAVEYGHAKVVGALLEAGADPESRSKRGSTPISVAKQFGRDDLLSQLMEYVR